MKKIVPIFRIRYIVFMAIVMTAFFVPSFLNFNVTNIKDPACIAWVTKASEVLSLQPSQRDGKYLQIRLLVEDSGVF